MTDLTFWVLLFGTAVLTSIISGILGMAGGILLLMVLLLKLDPVVAVPVHGIIQVVSNGSRAIFLRRHVAWGAVLRFVWPLLPAGALGMWVARSISPSAGQVAIGVFVLVASWVPGAISVLESPGNAQRALPIGGALIGFLSVVVGATGPLLGPFVLALGLGSEASVATMAACQIFQHGTKVLLFGVTGFSFASYLLPTLALCAAAVIGSALGTKLLDRVPQQAFRRIVRLVLSALAVQLIVEGGLKLLRITA